MKYLFLFTITPVQTFISQSRKLKDLFGSSQILSNMSEIGIKICKREGAKEIFPILNETQNKSYPNRFLVEFENKEIEDIRNIANNIENILKQFLINLVTDDKAKKQIKNYFYFYWAISEFIDSYKEAFDEIEKNLAGAKNSIVFRQIEEDGMKCSICGERSFVYKDKFKKGEKLCGVCWTKRDYAKTNFDSTAEITLKYIENSLNVDLKKEFKLLSKDYQLFFEENLNKDYFEKNSLSIDLKKSKEELKKFKKLLKDNNLKQTSYYTVIMFDGDNMGKWLSGEKLNDTSELMAFHRFLSEKLVSFAKEAVGITKKYGVNVYAGGEDFLGFISLPYIFDVMMELRENWNEVVNNPIKQKFNTADFTFSAGIVIAHYKTPLQYVLNSVRSAEKKAKNKDSEVKNKICIGVLKRSGESRESIIEFNQLKDVKNLYEELKNNFSNNFISVLEREFFLLDDNVRQFRVELKRTLNRSKLRYNIDINKTFNILDSFVNDNNIQNTLELLNILKFLKAQV